MTRVHLVLVGIGGVLGALAAIAGGSGLPGEVAPDRDVMVAPLQLAAWIKDRHPGLRVIDVRPAHEFDEFHLPTAENAPLSEPAIVEADEAATVVVYAGEGASLASLEAKVRVGKGGGGRIHMLQGGLGAWVSEVLNPVLLPDASPAERAAFEKASALSRYFGGVPRRLDASEAAAYRAKKPAASIPRGRGC